MYKGNNIGLKNVQASNLCGAGDKLIQETKSPEDYPV